MSYKKAVIGALIIGTAVWMYVTGAGAGALPRFVEDQLRKCDVPVACEIQEAFERVASLG